MVAPLPARGVNDGVPGLDTSAIFADKQRKDRMRKAWQAYSGDWGAGPLRVEQNSRQPNPNVHPNRISNIVDTGVTWLFGQPVRLQVVNNTASGPNLNGKQLAACQAYLDTCWGDPDDMMTVLGEMATNGGVFGHAFARILPADPSPESAHPYPRVVVLDPMTVTVTTDPDDCKRAIGYSVEYSAYDPVRRQQFEKRQLITRADDGQSWTITNQIKRQDMTAWMDDTEHATDGDDDADDSSGLWPHPFPPIHSCQNRINPNEFWGQPDVRESLIELNKQIQFAESNLNKIIYLQGHPRIFAAGVKMDNIKSEPGSVTALPSENSKVFSVTVEANIAPILEHVQSLRDDMDEESGIPGVATGRSFPTGMVSGITMRLMYAPLLQQTEWKRRLYGRLIREVSQIMLVLGGLIQREDDVRIEMHWQDPLPTDDLAAAQAISALLQAGILSKQTAAGMVGLDWEVEQERMDEEQANAVQGMMSGKGPVMPAMRSAAPPAPVAPANANTPDTQPGTPGAPPVMHPAAVQARQAAQAAAGKPVTAGGL
ncbi:MAG: phage portal protein [Ktedonobacterales bacterium]|nr:phage portal protein [Ktedonobacterales bacterium]